MRSPSPPLNLRRAGQVTVDACLLALAYYLAYVLRFDSGIPPRYQHLLGATIAFVVITKLWRFVDQKDFEAIVKAVVVSSALVVVATFLISFSGPTDPPRGVIALDFLITLALVIGSRFLVR